MVFQLSGFYKKVLHFKLGLTSMFEKMGCTRKPKAVYIYYRVNDKGYCRVL